MPKLDFFDVSKEYIAYLKRYDGKIPNIAYDKHDKFICGVLFTINGMNYYAPISSFKKQQKTNILIRGKKGNITSSIRLSFMFPVPDNKIIAYDFSREKGFYKYLLLEERQYCNAHAEAIIRKAHHVYNTVVSGKDPIMRKNCCDFRRLEAVCRQYAEQSTERPDPIAAARERAEQGEAPER